MAESIRLNPGPVHEARQPQFVLHGLLRFTPAVLSLHPLVAPFICLWQKVGEEKGGHKSQKERKRARWWEMKPGTTVQMDKSKEGVQRKRIDNKKLPLDSKGHSCRTKASRVQQHTLPDLGTEVPFKEPYQF